MGVAVKVKTLSNRGERGLTLIEVLFALLLLSFGLLAIAPLFAGSVKTGASSNQLASANTLAREKLEELIGYPTTDPRLSVPVGKNAAHAVHEHGPFLGAVEIVRHQESAA